MWNIMLVEDEPFVRRSISQCIAWEKYGFRLVAEAEDGEEGWRYMQTEQIDVVITDIMMPIVDGITLLKQAKEQRHPALFIMLTCLNEFEMARQALQYGATSYLLKLSMEEEELADSLLKARRQLAEQRRVKLRNILMDLYKEWWEQLLGKEKQQVNLEALEIQLPAYVQIIVQLPSIGSLTVEQVYSWYEEKYWDFLHIHLFKRSGYLFVFVWMDDVIDAACISIRQKRDDYTISSMVTTDQFVSKWQSILFDLTKLWYEEGRNHVTKQQQHWRLSWKKEREWLQLIEQKEWESSKLLLRSLWQQMALENKLMIRVKETAARFDQMIARMTEKEETPQQVWDSAATHEHLLQLLLARIDNYAKFDIKYAISDHPEISRIIDYVSQHLEEPLTLKAMAQYVNMNEQYVSSLFKKETGETFINYVQRLRIELAQYYLRETNWNVQYIGDQVGIIHKNYFLKLFRKQTGVSPSQYRHMQQK